MREILFRGKRTDNGEWIEGVTFPHDNGSCTTFYQNPLDGSLAGEEVDPDTVGQFTGHTDRNGKPIFEGDIIKYHGGPFKVVWQYTGFQARAKDGMLMPWVYISDDKDNAGEIVGNIYDNPELMEGESDE